MNWQEKYYEIALKAVMNGRMIQKQFQDNGNPTPSIYDKVTKQEAHRIADELDRLHDMDVPYRKESPKKDTNDDTPF